MKLPVQSLSLTLARDLSLKAGELVWLSTRSGSDLTTPEAVLQLPVGTSLGRNAQALFEVVSVAGVPGDGAAEPAQPMLALRVEADHDLAAGELTLDVWRKGFAVAVIILSDKGAAGLREDKCAPIITSLIQEKLELCLVQPFLIPDDSIRLRALIVDLCLTQGYDLVLTSGGTGVGPRDITPEATLAVIDKRLPGYERAMTAASLAKTPHGAISRAVAGTLGDAVVVNMPGSPKAVAENLEPLLPTLTHTIEKLQGDPSDCAKA